MDLETPSMFLRITVKVYATPKPSSSAGITKSELCEEPIKLWSAVISVVLELLDVTSQEVE
mgnify:FL=1